MATHHVDSAVVSPGRSPALLLVCGTVHGRRAEALVTGLAEVVERIARWVADDPDALGSWGLRDDYSEPLMMPVRWRAFAVHETLRVAHLVRLLPGESHGATLVTLCGERLALLGVEVLAVGAGMPCERCLAGGLLAARRDVIGRTFSELDSQIV